MFRKATAWDGLPGPVMAARLASLTTLPGPELASAVHPGDGGPAVTAEVRELADLPDADLLEVFAASEAHAAWTAAQQLLILAEFARRQPPQEAEFSADQIAPAVTWTRLTAGARLNLAQMACGQYPELLDGMLEGTISLPKAQIICDQTSCLNDAIIDKVMTTVLPHVPGWTTGQLRHNLARIIVAADPDGARIRAERAKKGRDVFLRQGEHGNATLQALLDAYDAAAAFEIIDRAAHTTATPGDTRNLGQRRSDVLIDLILGRTTTPTTDPASSTPAASQPDAAAASPADTTSPPDTDRMADGVSPADAASPAGAATSPAGAATSPAGADSPASETSPAAPAAGTTPAESAGSPRFASEPPPEPAASPSAPAQAATRPAPEPSPPPSADPGPAAPARPAGRSPSGPSPAGQSAAGQSAAGPSPAGQSPAGPSPGGQSPGGQDRGTSVGSIINVVIPFSTLAALLPGCLPAATTTTASAGRAACQMPGWIEGLGVTAASSIRELVTDLLNGARGTSTRIGWRIIACNDDTGAPHAIGHTRYRPPPALQELVRLRDRTCRFPGCRQPAARCDLDHAVAFADGGPTCDCDLHCLCRHHHRLKQHPGWTVHLTHGTSTWTSPTGHTYTSTPHPDWTDSTPIPDWARNPDYSDPASSGTGGTGGMGGMGGMGTAGGGSSASSHAGDARKAGDRDTDTDNGGTSSDARTGTGTEVSSYTRTRNPSLPAQPADDPDDPDETISRWNALTPENVAWLGRTQPPAKNTRTRHKTSRQPCTAYAPDTTPDHVHDGRCLGTDPPY